MPCLGAMACFCLAAQQDYDWPPSLAATTGCAADGSLMTASIRVKN
jgi:hypothetical protein